MLWVRKWPSSRVVTNRNYLDEADAYLSICLGEAHALTYCLFDL